MNIVCSTLHPQVLFFITIHLALHISVWGWGEFSKMQTHLCQVCIMYSKHWEWEVAIQLRRKEPNVFGWTRRKQIPQQKSNCEDNEGKYK